MWSSSSAGEAGLPGESHLLHHMVAQAELALVLVQRCGVEEVARMAGRWGEERWGVSEERGEVYSSLSLSSTLHHCTLPSETPQQIRRRWTNFNHHTDCTQTRNTCTMIL